MRNSWRWSAPKERRRCSFDPVVRLDPSPASIFPVVACRSQFYRKRCVSLRPKVRHGEQLAVSGALTVSGKPLLANDPASRARGAVPPVCRALGRSRMDVIGAASRIAGVPRHNERIGWDSRFSVSDQQDLYIENSYPADPWNTRRRAGGSA